MRSPKDMEIIEIDITNACVHQCANCTRFCGHHKKPFFMDFDTFKKAVDSLNEYCGMIGIIGGEPTLHPEFDKFVDYLRGHRDGVTARPSGGPITDMQFHILSTLDKGISKAVLLSTISPSYYKHYEVINDTFSYQLINDHSSDSLHQALLMSRKELGISDAEWLKKREACWIQNTWSATITPKGAFYCEVAGALDMLFEGPGGWKVDENWWKRKPKDFVDQLHWCELCSACLDVPKRLSHDERDDVTPQMYERLRVLGSPKAVNNRCVVRNPSEYASYSEPSFEKGDEYIEAGEEIRISPKNRSLFPKNITMIDEENLENGLDISRIHDWVLAGSIEKLEYIKEFMEDKVWNPGNLYIIDGDTVAFNVNAKSLKKSDLKECSSCGEIKEYYPEGKIVIVNTNDPLLFLIGGDKKEDELRGSRDGKHLVVYGAGNIGKSVVKLLDDHGYTDFDVAVTKLAQDKRNIGKHCIREIGEFKDKAQSILVIIAVAPWLYAELTENLESIGIKNYRFIA